MYQSVLTKWSAMLYIAVCNQPYKSLTARMAVMHFVTNFFTFSWLNKCLRLSQRYGIKVDQPCIALHNSILHPQRRIFLIFRACFTDPGEYSMSYSFNPQEQAVTGMMDQQHWWKLLLSDKSGLINTDDKASVLIQTVTIIAVTGVATLSWTVLVSVPVECCNRSCIFPGVYHFGSNLKETNGRSWCAYSVFLKNICSFCDIQ